MLAHTIAIPSWAQQLAPQRRTHPSETGKLDFTRTALLVIDMQCAFTLPDAPLAIPYAPATIPPINALADTVRREGGKVIWIQTDFSQEWDRWSIWFQHKLKPDSAQKVHRQLAPDSPGFDLDPALDLHKTDLHLVKTRFSPFAPGSSQISELLEQHGLDTVIITGTVSNTCCESTARDAMMRNLRCIFIADANSARTDEEHNNTLGNILQVFGEVAHAQDLIDP